MDTIDPVVSALKKACEQTACFVPMYCAMPDHLHVMFTGQCDDSDAWLAMVKFKGMHGKYLHASGAQWRWQAGFHDHIIRGVRDWREHARYIAMNPVHAGLCKEVGDYPFVGTIGVEWSDIFWS